MVIIDLTNIEEPCDVEMIGGPFDGSSIRLATEMLEQPPKAILIECDPTTSRGKRLETYIFTNNVERDGNGEQIGERWGYFYQSSEPA